VPNFIDVDVIDDTENKQYLIKLKDKDKKEKSRGNRKRDWVRLF
jgi:hypothetical protein